MALYFADGSHMTAPMAEGWRVTSGFTGNAHPITNWEKQDDVHGSGVANVQILTESNGVFTFAKLGYYLVTWTHYGYLANGSSRFNEMYLGVSWNQGSNYDYHGYGTGSIAHISNGNNHGGLTCSSIVTGTANTRLRFRIYCANGNVQTGGSTNEQTTGFTIHKVAGL
jgi:hypothetical protein